MSVHLQRFGLTLVVNHACNLRCTYCYTGAKFNSAMPRSTGIAAIDRAFRSLVPDGHLDLGFFGGEPMIEAGQILDWMAYSRIRAQELGKHVHFSLTTNGTFTHRDAWQVMLADDLDLAVSFDGDPATHDRHRRDAHGNGSAALVEATIKQLVRADKSFRVVVVVRPDNLDNLIGGLNYLYGLGIRYIDLSLDLWTTWTAADGRRLQSFVMNAAELWHRWLPDFSLSWFDAKAAEIAQLPSSAETTRCGFGHGEISVAPSGRLYPCERLVGEDRPDSPMRLPGNAVDGHDFLDCSPAPFSQCQPCSQCALADACDTDCRCSNFIRTGDVNRPDGLLCILNKATAEATARMLSNSIAAKPFHSSDPKSERQYHVEPK
jgi:uncharacterized protein